MFRNKDKNNDPWLRKRQIFSSQMLQGNKKVGLKWRVLPVLWLAFKKASMLVGACVIISSVVSLWVFSSVLQEMNAEIEVFGLPEEMVLYLEINGDIPDQAGAADFSRPLLPDMGTMKNHIDALEKAGEDPRVKGVYVRIGGGGLSLAHAQEFRKALFDFKKSGKFAYIYASSFDQGMGSYYLAGAFDEIWMQPLGVVMISGISMQVPYLRDVLDKIGVYPQIYKRKEYKSAYDTFTQKQMSKASRRENKLLVEDMASIISKDISADMGITPKEFKVIVDKGLYLDYEALETGLVDVLDYEDALVEKINEQLSGDFKGDEPSYVDFDKYISEMIDARENLRSGEESEGDKIALVYLSGMIVGGSSENSSSYRSNQVSFGGEDFIAADDIVEVLGDIEEDDSYGVVVLRIDSPGGSPVASEAILHALLKVKDAGKNVIVSMGATAASGGYWIASGADRIFALPASLTGSIGVLGGKFSLERLWDNIHVNWDEVSWGKNAGMWSVNNPYTKSEGRRINAMMDNVYDNFIERVAKGRNMSVADVEKVAKGRVWSGKRAVEVGLVDEIGGLVDALDYAAREMEFDDRHDVDVNVLPEPLTPLEQLIELLGEQVRAGKSLRIQAGMFASLWSQIAGIMNEKELLSVGAAVYEPASRISVR